MILGTSTQAGKTTIVAGLCRLFSNRGVRVTPFKAQNMALNSFVTLNGEEIGRSTAVQAQGARLEPNVHMNPILLKPKADELSQLIVHGKAVRDVSSKDYFVSNGLRELKWNAVTQSVARLQAEYELIVAEGAGSCAEPNLREIDIVNWKTAHLLGARVFIIADIDRGGAFADLIGTMRVLERISPHDLDLVEGFILNKFRGDRSLLTSAIRFVEDETHRPVAGVLPYVHGMSLEEEDAIKTYPCENPEVDIAIVRLPHTSNANDFDFLAAEENVRVRWVGSTNVLGFPDAIVLPGSKNTTWDLDYIRRIGLADAVINQADSGITVVGICGGYQMLGRRLVDEEKIESKLGTLNGLGLLDMETYFEPEKVLRQRRYEPTAHNPFAEAGTIEGYEIHCGRMVRGASTPLYTNENSVEGAINAKGNVWGTFVHDIFRNRKFTRCFVNSLRLKNGLGPLTSTLQPFRTSSEESYERLAVLLETECGF